MRAAGEPRSSTGGTVRVLPSGISFDVGPEEPVIRGARRAGYSWPSICGGDAVCQACALTIREGAENAGPMGPTEAEALGTRIRSNGFPIRLACQVSITGPMTVHKAGVRPTRAQGADASSDPTPIGTMKGI